MNDIDKSAKLSKNVVLGNHISVGANSIIEVEDDGILTIGHNVRIGDNVKISTSGNCSIGHWTTLHDNIVLMSGNFQIGTNCWFGQNTILDASGGLVIEDGVRIGLYSQVWTHVAAGELIEGCRFYDFKPVNIRKDAWLVGTVTVNPGVTIGNRCVILPHSIITKDLKGSQLYKGQPAREVSFDVYREVGLVEKFEMLSTWLEEFSRITNTSFKESDTEIVIYDEDVSVTIYLDNQNLKPGEFCIKTKEFRMSNTSLERRLYKYLMGNKARFHPYE
jgi:acetyltransferase-like isoleucine patch superfamily enzyme